MIDASIFCTPPLFVLVTRIKKTRTIVGAGILCGIKSQKGMSLVSDFDDLEILFKR